MFIAQEGKIKSEPQRGDIHGYLRTKAAGEYKELKHLLFNYFFANIKTNAEAQTD